MSTSPSRPRADGSVHDFTRVNRTRSFVLLGAGALAGIAIAGYGLFTAHGTRIQGVPPESDYRFKHALIQDAAYENLLKSRRQVLHRRAAEVRTTIGTIFFGTRDPLVLVRNHRNRSNPTCTTSSCAPIRKLHRWTQLEHLLRSCAVNDVAAAHADVVAGSRKSTD